MADELTQIVIAVMVLGLTLPLGSSVGWSRLSRSMPLLCAMAAAMATLLPWAEPGWEGSRRTARSGPIETWPAARLGTIGVIVSLVGAAVLVLAIASEVWRSRSLARLQLSGFCLLIVLTVIAVLVEARATETLGQLEWKRDPAYGAWMEALSCGLGAVWTFVNARSRAPSDGENRAPSAHT